MKELEKYSSSGMDSLGQSEKQIDSSQSEQARDLERYFPSSSLIKSFSHALYGIKETWLCQRNFKIHTFFAITALCLAAVLQIDSASWLILTLTIAFVLTAELINTSLEHLVDLAANSLYHPLAKAAKDAAAGAVLVVSFSALISGLIIFLPRLLPYAQQATKLLPH